MNFDFETYMKKIDYSNYENKIKEIETKFNNDNMSDWKNVASIISKKELVKIKNISLMIRKKCDVFLVIGIGGSYLGSKMIIDSLSNYFDNKIPEIIFVGTSLSTNYLVDLKKYLRNKDVCVNVISKSGSTMETKITFEYIVNEILSKKYDDYSDRIFVTTDSKKSILLDLAKEKGYETFSVPEGIGGRYSVLSAVGLLPVAVGGFDIDALLKGALDSSKNIDDAIKYAIIRHEMYLDRKIIESYTFYEEIYLSLGEWLKQLFAETQGKEGKAILPISTLNTRDLHSLGQYFQEGERILFETVINVNSCKKIKTSYKKDLNEINNIAVKSVMKAHFDDDVYGIIMNFDEMDEYTLGYMIYFFMIAAAYGGYLLDVYPFDQPGVSKYKNIINENLKKV